MTPNHNARDWPQIFREIDRDVAAWTPESLRMTYVRHGCAVVRGAIDVATIGKVRAVTDDLYAHSNDFHVYDPQIAQASGGRLSGFDLIAHPTLTRFLDLIFVGQRYQRESATARRIKGRAGNADWQEPLSLHLDSYFHHFFFTVNFWVPFDECGSEAPGIQLLPIDYRQTRRYSGFSRSPIFADKGFDNARHFPHDSVGVDALEADFGSGCLFHPVVKPGDVVVASNWIIHGSYRTSAMAKGRSSMELRFIGTCPDIAVKPDAADRTRIAAWFFANRVVRKLRGPSKTGLPFWAQQM
jgi:hypothetical protein